MLAAVALGGLPQAPQFSALAVKGIMFHVVTAPQVDGASFEVIGIETNDPELMAELKAKRSGNPRMKILISIGGWSFSTATGVFEGRQRMCSASCCKTMLTAARPAHGWCRLDTGWVGQGGSWLFPALTHQHTVIVALTINCRVRLRLHLPQAGLHRCQPCQIHKCSHCLRSQV